ncbi:MAG: hypothetical protein K2O96_02760, partial [Lachnospiraceae bacterium]|nr:hypothetical protein [Lachnospiraceae bacterium]
YMTWHTFSQSYELLYFLMILVMLVHVRSRAYEYKLLELMGIKKKHRRWFIGCEFGSITIISMAGGSILGYALSGVVVVGIRQLFPEVTVTYAQNMTAFWATIFTGIGEFLMLFFIFAMIIDLLGMEAVVSIGRGSGKPVKNRWKILLIGLGLAILSYSSQWFYWGKVSGNFPLFSIEIGLLCVLIGAGSVWLYRMRFKAGKYFRRLPWLDNWYHRFFYNINMTYIMAVFLVLALCSCSVLFFDSLPFEAPENYPYDIVWIADREDETFVRSLEGKYDIDVKMQPCIRVTTPDVAEHTGISEKDYEAWTGESLNLKDAEVHVVYQRERSERNDLGIDYGTKTPEIYAGMMRGDLWNYVAGVDVKTSDFDKQYTIVSKEDRILTGVFEDSKWEHIIVFSDEHFEELKAKADGANLTVMLNVSEQEEAVASEINDYMNKQNEKQKADGNREFLLYEKNPLLLQSKQSHVIQVTIIVLNVIILAASLLFVWLIKVECDLPDMKWKYEFYTRSGIEPKKRKKYIFKETFLSGAVPVTGGILLSLPYIISQIYLKHLPKEWLLRYSVRLGLTLLGVAGFFGTVILILTYRNVKSIERGDGR